MMDAQHLATVAARHLEMSPQDRMTLLHEGRVSISLGEDGQATFQSVPGKHYAEEVRVTVRGETFLVELFPDDRERRIAPPETGETP